MSLVPYSNGTAPSQEWSVIQRTKPKRYDDSENNAVMQILGGVATDGFRSYWEDKYPGRDQATVAQLLGAYCYDPPKDIPQDYWIPAMKQLKIVEKAEADRCERSDWPASIKDDYFDDLWELRKRRKEWYKEMKEDPGTQLWFERNKDTIDSSEQTDDLFDPRHNSQPRTGLNMWERRVKERIEQGTYKYTADEEERSGQYDTEHIQISKLRI
jgi:hypothetical protein